MCVKYFFKKKILAFVVVLFFCFPIGSAYADNASGMPDWTDPEVSGSFSSEGVGKIVYSFSDSGGTKTGPAGSAVYTFNVPKGNVISISVRADDSATIEIPLVGVSANSYWDSSQKSIVPGEATSEFVDLDEVEGEALPVTVNYANRGGPYVLSFSVRVVRVKTEIDTVDISASTKLVLAQDDGMTFDGSDWEKGRSRDGKSRESNPISVTSGSALTFIPSFVVLEGIVPAKVKAEFSIPGNNVSPQIKDYADISTGFEIPSPVTTGEVNYFDNSLSITWSVQYPGCDKWFPAGVSTHEIYFTHATPRTNLRQETVFWVACSGGVVGKTAETEIVNAIWRKFSNGTSPANLTRKDGHALTYWSQDEQTPNNDASGLINDLDGRCGAWASFLGNALNVHGILTMKTILYPEEKERDGFLIDNYEFSAVEAQGLPDGFTHILDFSTEGDVADGYVKDRNGIAGQSNANPYSLFKNHQLVLVEDRFLDPSYGIEFNILRAGEGIVAGAVREEAFAGKNIAKKNANVFL